MVVVSIKVQRLTARDDSSDGEHGEWGIPQIVTPIGVGAGLLLLFAAYIIWQRRRYGRCSYDYHHVRPTWIAKMFVPRQKRQRVVHSNTTVTLDDSMRTSAFTLDFNRRSRQTRSDSSDSQTPLTSTSYTFNYPPGNPYPPNNLSDSPPPMPRRLTVRWWWLFGSRPQQIKSEEPGQRWRVDDPDGSSSWHGHPSQNYRYASTLEPLREAPDCEDRVIRIGENFSSVASSPMTQHIPEQTRFVRGMPTVPEHPSTRSRTPVLAASAPQSSPGTPMSSVDRGLPPSYDLSQTLSRYPSQVDSVRLARAGPYMGMPPAVRAAAYPSPHAFHGRELSSDSFLATQPPMVAPSVY